MALALGGDPSGDRFSGRQACPAIVYFKDGQSGSGPGQDSAWLQVKHGGILVYLEPEGPQDIHAQQAIDTVLLFVR